LFTAIGLRNYARLDEFAPYVIEDGFREPFETYDARNPNDYLRILDEIDRIIDLACAALDWYQHGAGTVKGDLVIHDEKITIIELAARLSGGFFASHGHPLAYGVDFVGEAIKAALGYRCESIYSYQRGYVCQRYVFPAPDDIGKTVVAIEDVRAGKIPIECATWNINPGDVVQPVTCHPRRWGQALATGRTPEEARQRAEAAVIAMKAGMILE